MFGSTDYIMLDSTFSLDPQYEQAIRALFPSIDHTGDLYQDLYNEGLDFLGEGEGEYLLRMIDADHFLDNDLFKVLCALEPYTIKIEGKQPWILMGVEGNLRNHPFYAIGRYTFYPQNTYGVQKQYILDAQQEEEIYHIRSKKYV